MVESAMANRKRKTVAVEQSAHITSLQAHAARSKPFGKRRRATLALWSRRKSLAFILGASLGLWALAFGLAYLFYALL